MQQAPEPTVTLHQLTYTLPDLERDCWKQLASAPARKQDGFKTMTLATLSAEPARPDARTVVLRQADESAKRLWFHTDRRAEKVAQLTAYPFATLLFWDEKRQVQLRLTVETTLHTDDAEADAHWAKTWVGSRKMYLSEHTPGRERPAPYPGFPESLGDALPSEAASEAGRPNFAVVACRVLTLDYLHLSRAGQTRARFQYVPEPVFCWLAP